MQRRDFMMLAVGLPLLSQTMQGATAEITADVLEDKIRGGFLGQIVGDLNGLKHEMKYILEPGSVQEYTPGLPDGGWTDDGYRHRMAVPRRNAQHGSDRTHEKARITGARPSWPWLIRWVKTSRFDAVEALRYE